MIYKCAQWSAKAGSDVKTADVSLAYVRKTHLDKQKPKVLIIGKFCLCSVIK